MRMRDTFLKPMHPEGYKFVAIFCAITAALFLISSFLGWIGVGLSVWCYYFFRDPKRATPTRDGLVVSPADGVVSLIEKAIPPAELGMADHALPRVSLFMSVFNCHVNRAPIGGEIKAIAYRPGKFFNASLDKVTAMMEHAFAHHLHHEPSMLQDRMAGRRTEIDALNGAVVRIGEDLGVPTPANRIVTDLIRLTEDAARYRA